ncbi:hypothetical protein EMIHUDRAFT_253743, partial [Emiliania huxleyi CCMP1516]|uniref:Uncharacterized protein n=2 Tax=Emiliania huxleyi TaxID=2903 RepID=A0A0D3K3H1_EMIH1
MLDDETALSSFVDEFLAPEPGPAALVAQRERLPHLVHPTLMLPWKPSATAQPSLELSQDCRAAAAVQALTRSACAMSHPSVLGLFRVEQNDETVQVVEAALLQPRWVPRQKS